MFSEAINNSRGVIHADNAFLPDLQLIGDLNDESFGSKSPPKREIAAAEKIAAVQLNRFVGLVGRTPTSDGGNLTDRIVSNAFQQCFCNELFDLLGGFVC